MSKEQAKRRLRQVLVYDRAMLSPAALDELKQALIMAAQEYIESDPESATLHLELGLDGATIHFKMPAYGIPRREEPPID
ncbi:MAG: cell division topological specificity factor MinE [Peptococcaceae bacterium]|nr:cell division topological specificity factor MinE [Peptococcaceae bacterium]